MGDSFLSKSFLFEIVDSATQKIEESFTLVLPPQSYSIKEKQRVNITKTFGNAFVDDYGPDNIEMTIKGISGTAHAFPTFRTTGVSMGKGAYTLPNKLAREIGMRKASNIGVGALFGGAFDQFRHKEGFYYFRDNIMRYKDKLGFDKKELRVYDLADEQAYKCVLLEFSVDRSSDKPFHYPFTISLFVYERFGSKDVTKAKLIRLGKDPLQALDNIMYGIERFKQDFVVFKTIQKVQNGFARFEKQSKKLRRFFRSWLIYGRKTLVSPLIMVKQTLSGLTELSSVVNDAKEQGSLLMDDYAEMKENLDSQWVQLRGVYGYAIEEGSQIAQNETVAASTESDYGDGLEDALPPDPELDAEDSEDLETE